jgi:hypothetical protein
MSPEDLYKIVLNIDENWSVSCVKLDDKQEEVIVSLLSPVRFMITERSDLGVT